MACHEFKIHHGATAGRVMFFTKFALLTCAIYLGFAILVDGVSLLFGPMENLVVFLGSFRQSVTRWIGFLRCNVVFRIPDLVADCDDSSACSN